MSSRGLRGVAWVFLAISIAWGLSTIFPLVYTTFFPYPDVQQILLALEGRELPREAISPLVKDVTDSTGHMRRAIKVNVSWRLSGEYNVEQSHSSKRADFSYVAWFEKRSKPTILVLTRTEVDHNLLRYEANEGQLLPILSGYVFPMALLTFSISCLWWTGPKRLSEKQTK